MAEVFKATIIPRYSEQRVHHVQAIVPGELEAGWLQTPSPGPPRLMKTPAAVHPLPQGGEGRLYMWWDVCKAGGETPALHRMQLRRQEERPPRRCSYS
ncbi:hypothetical protein SBA2_450063 [Acidobacteriia bacterium SbA2]|nr:hypothetical protein SBA2_450063 [Acidobacteriia bacterium SbA2]